MNYWNTNQIAEDKVEIHVGWQRFKNAQGNWQPISRLITDAGGDFVMNNAPFSCTFPRWSHAIATMTVTCRYDIFKKEDVTADPYTMTIRARETAEVKGKLFDMNGTGVFDAVIYEGAYPQWNADLIYYVHHGRAPELRKLLRYNSHPLVAHKPSFFVDTSHNTELSSRNIPDGMTRRQHRDACKVILDSVDGELQPVPLESDGGFYCRKDGEAQKRGIGIKDAMLWDSGEGEEQKRRRIPSNMRRREGHYTFIKRVPARFFDDAVFPCYTDATATFYPDPHPETTSVDGWIYDFGAAGTGEDWATLYNGGGTESNSTSVGLNIEIRSHTTSNKWTLFYRSAALFDTSALGAGATISDATLSGNTRLVDDNFSQSVALVDSSPASDTELAAGDYDEINSVEQSDTRINLSDAVIDSYSDFPLNATGIASISKTGITKFGFRLSGDLDNNEPTWASNTKGRIGFFSADEAGTTKDPKLVVTYTEAEGGIPNMLMMGIGG